MAGFFEPGEEIVGYRGADELVDKIRCYLAHDEERKRIVLAGYRRVRVLSAEHEAYLDAFIALRLVQDALWILEWRQHPALGADWAAQARQVLAMLAALLAAGTVAPAAPG